MNSSSSFEISQDTVRSSGENKTCLSACDSNKVKNLWGGKKKNIIIYNNICISDRFLVWRESSQWCGPALLWFPESGLLHSGGSSPSSAWLFWPAHCPSGGPYSKQHSGVKLLLQDTNKSSITLTVLTHQLRHSAASHHQSAFHISHMMWQVKFLRHQV